MQNALKQGEKLIPNKKLPLKIALGMALIFGTFTSAKADGNGSPSDPNIRYIGRWERTNSTLYNGYWSGVYLRARFTGTSVGIRLDSNTGLAVSIDGEPPRFMSGVAGVNALNSAPLKAGEHTLQVGSGGQNYEVGFQGLVLDEGATTKPVLERPLIEYIGDSITQGNGSYAWLSAEMLGADHIQIAFSARALTSGFGCANDKTGLDKQYFRLKNFNHPQDDPPIAWDFSYTPQIIVINLGQNDQCGQEPPDTLTASYLSFVRNIRAKFPQTQIVALRPFSGAYADAERKAVETLNAGGDQKVRFVDTTGWLDKEKEDFLDNIHPNASGSLKAAWHLANVLSPLLKP